MSNISVQFVFALVMLVASISASFAQQAGSATTHRNVPITTLGSRVGKCFQGRPARAAAHNSAQFIPVTFVGYPSISPRVRESKRAWRRRDLMKAGGPLSLAKPKCQTETLRNAG